MSSFLLAFLRERRCSSCAQPFMPRLKNERLCPSCADKIIPKAQPFCPVCGEIFSFRPDGRNFLCPACQNQLPAWGKIYFYAPFNGLLRDMILRLKFAGELHLAFALATLLTSPQALAPLKLQDITNYDFLLPVPLHPSRLRERGFNQAGEICRHLSKQTGVKTRPALARNIATRHQIGLSRRERVQNMRAAFSALPCVKNKNILLVDDVMTTGATLGAAARCLLAAGAAQVDIAVPARTRARNMLHESRHL